jgi:molybdopterin-guanine dinucleotide biosynthesis protein A
MSLDEPITALILAGGKSTRMGVDKGLLLLEGKPMVQHVIDAAKMVTDQVLIIANLPGYYELGYPVYSDLAPETGPIGGIFTGLQHSNSRKNLVLACDTPFITFAAIDALIQACGTEWVTAARYENQIQPLFAIYDQSCTATLLNCIHRKAFKLQTMLHNLDNQVKIVDMQPLLYNKVFTNINTPDDFLTNTET